MGKKINRECIICKTKYHYCPTCGEDSSKPTWYFIFDGENCHDIYDVCTKYRDKEIDAEGAYNLISKLDLSKINEFAESTRLQIEEIIEIHNKSTINSTKPKENGEKAKTVNKDVSKNITK
jgi:hypothetical protein